MEKLGFQERGRYFASSDIELLVEFPNGPLSVGEELVKEVHEFKLATGTLRVISPTDCVKDRLCAFYFWNDQQGLAQAVLVTESQSVDLKEIKRWSKIEDKEREYEISKRNLLDVEHRFHSIEEELTVLVFFAPAEYSLKK